MQLNCHKPIKFWTLRQDPNHSKFLKGLFTGTRVKVYRVREFGAVSAYRIADGLLAECRNKVNLGSELHS